MSGLFKHGARFELRRASGGADGARYEASVELPDGERFEWRVDVAADGTFEALGEPVERRPDGADDAPEWTVDFLATLLKQAARAGAKTGRFPRKVKRWRESPA